MSIPGIIGAVIGFVVAGPAGALKGFTIGSAVGSFLFPSGSNQQGPRLSDLTPQTSEYGKPIPIVYGTVGIGGNVIWSSPIVEKAATTQQGGKGGGGASVTNYSYFGNFAILLAEGERSIGKMWAGPDKRLVWDGVTLEGGGSVRLYTGSETQLPDALIESYLGVGNVPAYRGSCYAVFEMFPLLKDGNRLPFITAEVGSISGIINRAPVYLGEAAPIANNLAGAALIDSKTGLIWSLQSPTNLASTVLVRVNSDLTQSQVKSFSITPSGTFTSTSIAYLPSAGVSNWPSILQRTGYANICNLVVISGETFGSFTDSFLLFDADTRTYMGQIEGTSHGTGELEAAAYNPVRNEFMGFRYGARLVVDPLAAPPIAADVQLGVSVGSVYVSEVIVTSKYVAVMVSGTNYFCVLHRLSDYSFYAQVAIPNTLGETGQAFYDPDRERILIANGSGSFSISTTVVDLATATASVYTFSPSAGADISPSPSYNVVSGIYALGKYVFGANGGGAGAVGTTLYVVNPTSFVTEQTFTYEPYALGQMHSPLLPPSGNKPYLLSFDGTRVKRLYFKAASLGGQILSDVVANLSERAGLTASQYDVSPLIDVVDGYAIARQTTVRAAIDALRPAYYFDAVERSAQVVFIKRGGAIAMIIPDADLAAGDGMAAADDLMRTRQMEVELPRTLSVTHLSRATDYSSATKFAKRIVGSSVNETSLELPLVLTDSKAQQIADVNLHVAFVQRLSFSFTLPRRYSALEPTDIVVVKGKTMLLTKITASPRGVLKVDAVADAANYYVANPVVTETPTSGKVVLVPPATRLELL